MKKIKIESKILHKFVRSPVLVVATIFCVCALGVPIAHAITSGDIQSQINDLSQQNAQAQQTVNQLQVQANSYQDAINQLQAQINSIQNAIQANQAQQLDLQNQITAAEAELTRQKGVLGEDIKAMYLEGQISTIEMLASSKDLSDFINKQEYRNSVQNKLKDTLDKITALKLKLKTQKDQVDQLLQTEKAQQIQLDGDRAQQTNLLSMTQQQQGQYNQQIQANKSKIADLRAQQVAINNKGSTNVYIPPSSGGSGGLCDNGEGNGNYPMPWCNAPQDTIVTLADNGSGEGENRECTSYAYWYFTQVEHRVLHAQGNAGQWWKTAYGPGVYVDYTPEVGALGVLDSGPFGHIMVIRAVGPTNYQGVSVPDGQVLVSDMNHDYNGHFSYNLRYAGSLHYIHSN